MLAGGCSSCRRNHLRVRAIETGAIDFLDGEPVSPVRWTYEPETLSARAFRVDCSECGAVLWTRDDCPGCNARGALARAIDRRHGIASPPRRCPRCDHDELRF